MTELLATAGTQRSLLPALIKGCFHVIQRRLRADTEFTERIFQAHSQIQLEGEKIQGYSSACSWPATRRAPRWRCGLGLESRHAAPHPALPRRARPPLSLPTLPLWAHVPQHAQRQSGLAMGRAVGCFGWGDASSWSCSLVIERSLVLELVSKLCGLQRTGHCTHPEDARPPHRHPATPPPPCCPGAPQLYPKAQTAWVSGDSSAHAER